MEAGGERWLSLVYLEIIKDINYIPHSQHLSDKCVTRQAIDTT